MRNQTGLPIVMEHHQSTVRQVLLQRSSTATLDRVFFFHDTNESLTDEIRSIRLKCVQLINQNQPVVLWMQRSADHHHPCSRHSAAEAADHNLPFDHRPSCNSRRPSDRESVWASQSSRLVNWSRETALRLSFVVSHVATIVCFESNACTVWSPHPTYRMAAG